MAKEREYRWYVEPLNIRANAVLSAEIGEESCSRDMRDDSGKPHSVWACPFKIVQFMRRSKNEIGIVFHVFVQEGNGPLRSANFLNRRKKNVPREILAHTKTA